MEYEKMFGIVKGLEYDSNYTVYTEKGTSIYLFRPSKIPPRFKHYDTKKNFQIFLKEGERTFRPNHLRIMIDLHLRVRSNPDLSKELLRAFDEIYYHKDPDVAIANLKNVKFAHFLNPIGVIANLSQLFIIEQDYNYTGESNFEPPTLFYQGWIRQFIDSSKEIDNLCMSVCNRQPPASKYTKLENKKDKSYQENNTPLWYLDKK